MQIELEAEREVNATTPATWCGKPGCTPGHHLVRATALMRFEPSSSQLPARERAGADAPRTNGISTDVGREIPGRGTAAERTPDERAHYAEIRMLEMRHRIANSLQIVGSILQTKARSIESEEAREHLQDVHHRLMAVAAVQEQLTGDRDGETVSIERYLRRLCQIVARSIAGDEITIVVDAPDRVVDAGFITSLGLIVTELVINAVKHAFPEGTCDKRVDVVFRDRSDGWLLEVADNGVGVESSSDGLTDRGLGTRVVAALARRLGARIEASSGHIGTRISVRRLSQTGR